MTTRDNRRTISQSMRHIRVRELGPPEVMRLEEAKALHPGPGQVLGLTGGRGVDVILEMLANENLGKDLRLLAPFGRIVVIGSRGTVEIDPREAMVRDASILGTRLRNVSPEMFRTIHAACGDGFARGSLRPIVGKELPLAQAVEAHRAVMRPPAYGNIVLIPSS